MGSILYRGVRMSVYPNDHWPRHAHCRIGSAEVIVEFPDRDRVMVADRKDAMAGAKGTDSRRAVAAVIERYDELVEMWSEIHGS